MVRIRHRRRERPLFQLGEHDREIAAAWFVVLLAVAAGLAFLNMPQYGANHCSTTLAMPRVLHRPLAVAEDWDNLTCSSGPCSYMLSAHELDEESDGAAEPADDSAAAYSEKPQLPPDPIENTGKRQEEPLCS
jgi:hypothetical protein